MESYFLRENLLKIVVVTIIIFMLTILIIIQRDSNIPALRSLIPIEKINTNKKVVAIVCNVYEGQEEIDKILSILQEKNIKISFFVGGVWAKDNAATIIKMRNYGHDIQNHGYYHKLPSKINREKNIKEIKDTEELIYKISGVKTNLFEPPSGDFDETTLNLVNSLGYKTVTWSIDTIDWRKDATRDLILERIKKKLHPGGIILIHPKPVTAECFSDIINYLLSQEYRITSVTNLIANN
jgi:peptidoglycan-N-acetylglucosamine deacetylase